MPNLRRLLSGLLLGAPLLVAAAMDERPACAGETESNTLFDEGRDLRAKGNCPEAILKFRKALETFPEGLGALRNIAECETELGELASARRDWADLKVAVLQSNQPKYLNPPASDQGWDKDAAQAYAKLAERVAKVTIKVKGEHPDGMSVLVNGKPFDLGLLGVELEQDDGPLAVEVNYGAASPLKKTIEVKEKARETVELTLPEGAAAAARKKKDQEEGSSSGQGLKVGGGIALAVAGLAAIGTGVAVGIRQSALSTVEKRCGTPPKSPCGPISMSDAAVSAEGRGKAATTAMVALAATAGVAVVVGIPLIVMGTKSKNEDSDKPLRPTTSMNLEVGPLWGGASVGLGGRFQ